jgi:hypothetical protein
VTGVSERLGLPYGDERIRAVIEDAVGRVDGRADPRFYAVTGSHVYGFADDTSDVDLRGFHVAPAEEYATLDPPTAEVTVNMDGLTAGFEDVPELELRSYELTAFGEHVYGANYDAVELVLAAPAVMNGVALEMDALRALVREHLPLDVAHSYLGMARSNYYKHLDPEKTEAYDPRPKKVLYVLRGLLAAQYVQTEGDLETDVTRLAAAVDLDTGHDVEALVAELVEYKRETGGELPEPTVERAREATAALFNAVQRPADVDKTAFRAAVDDWLRKVRL